MPIWALVAGLGARRITVRNRYPTDCSNGSTGGQISRPRGRATDIADARKTKAETNKQKVMKYKVLFVSMPVKAGFGSEGAHLGVTQTSSRNGDGSYRYHAQHASCQKLLLLWVVNATPRAPRGIQQIRDLLRDESDEKNQYRRDQQQPGAVGKTADRCKGIDVVTDATSEEQQADGQEKLER